MKESINIVIVTYNNRDLLTSCIISVVKSLEKSGLDEKITVVDNASSDGTKELIQDRFPFVHYIRNDRNLGLTRSLNIGIKQGLDTLYTLLLNDDVELFPDTISMMLETLQTFHGARGIPACLIYPDGSPQRVKLKIIGVQKKMTQSIQYIQFAGTTACMYYTELFNKLGLFDEFYFFYNEDLDFSLRAKRNGIKFVFHPGIKVIHHRKKGRKKAVNAVKPYYYATDYYFYRKNYGLLFALVYLFMALFHITLWRRRFRKAREDENLLLLQKGREKLRNTVRNFKKLRSESIAV